MSTPKSPIILESGIASRGNQSTDLFNEVVRKCGGQFWSVDNDPELVATHRGNICPTTQLVCDDSVTFFKRWAAENNRTGVIYLDSYDLDFYNPEPSAKHGLAEYNSLKPVIDDTPVSPEWLDTRGQLYMDTQHFYMDTCIMPGKGMYVLDEVQKKLYITIKCCINFGLNHRLNHRPIQDYQNKHYTKTVFHHIEETMEPHLSLHNNIIGYC
jgi:hypothetical protein